MSRWAASLLLLSCELEPAEPQPTTVAVQRATVAPWSAPSNTQSTARRDFRVEPAPRDDTQYDSDERIAVTRFIYRARMVLPEKMQTGAISSVVGELIAETDDTRVTISFEGSGWPVAPRSVVRIRGDSGGSYVFDERGGRALAEGNLAAWWSGSETPRTPALWMPRARTTTRSNERTAATGTLLCDFFRELAGQSRTSDFRCSGGAPNLARVGVWQFQRTADVAIERPRRHLRADHNDPPSQARRDPVFRCLEMAAVERQIQIQNQGTTTAMIVLNDGARSALARGDALTIRGCGPDISVAALRPFGGAMLWPTRLARIDQVVVLRQ